MKVFEKRIYFNKKIFHDEILRLRPSFRLADEHFFEHKVEHIVDGFTWERPRPGIFIWKTAVALYESHASLRLGYGERLPRPNDLLVFRINSERQLASEFVERIESYRSEMCRVADIGEYINMLDVNGLSNPAIRYSYALALIIISEYSMAEQQLSQCLALNWNTDFESKVASTMRDLQDGVARKKLLCVELKTKSRLKI